MNEVVFVGDGLWPVFWAAAALMITGMAAWGSTMMMRLIGDRIEAAKRQLLDELDAVEERLAEPSDEVTAQG